MFQNVMTLYYTKYSDLCACQEVFLYPGASKYVEGALAEARQEAGPETRTWTFTNDSRPVMCGAVASMMDEVHTNKPVMMKTGVYW